MKNYKRSKKFLFFWIVFHSVGYLSYLLDIHPCFTVDNGNYRIYILTPETSVQKEQDNFYPFHGATTAFFYSSGVQHEFLGIYGYYGNSEYLYYVVVPLIVILLSWLYRKYIK